MISNNCLIRHSNPAYTKNGQKMEPPCWKSMFVCDLEVEKFLALPTNVRLGWKCSPRTNTVAYYENVQITDQKVL